MITKLIIDNFKAIEHLELDLRPFQVFVGPNDSGKSSILQALDLLGRSTAGGSNGSPNLFDESFERYLPHGDIARTMKLDVHGTGVDGDYDYRIQWAAKPSRIVFEELLVAGTSKLFHHRGEPSDRSTLSQTRVSPLCNAVTRVCTALARRRFRGWIGVA